jgi:cytosine permease
MAGGADGAGVAWYLRLGAWIGIGTSPGALVTGASIGSVTSAWVTGGAVVLGARALTGLAVANGLRAQRHGTPAVRLAALALGPRGPWTVALLVAVGVACWNGFYLGLASRAVGGFLGVPTTVVAVATGVLVFAIYRAGFRRWNVLVALTGAAATAVALLTYAGVPATEAASPPPASLDRMLLGAGFVVAYAAVFAVRAPDFTWDARRARDVLFAGGTLMATLVFFLGLGAAVYGRAGSWDFPTLVNATHYPAAAVALLALSIIAPSVSGLHSGALGLRHLTGWSPASAAVIVTGVAVTLGALSFDLALQPFLGLLGAVFPPVLATMLLRTDRHRDWHAWVAWSAGAVLATAVWLADFRVHVVAGTAVAAAVMIATRSLSANRLTPGRSVP